MATFMDHALARRLERVEGAVGSSFVEARARLHPELGVGWRDFAGTYAMFDGADSPMTQTFGLGLFGEVTDDGLAAIEAFFADQGADTLHEVSSLAGVATLARLVDRGYRPIELSTVLVRELADAPAMPSAPGLRVRAIDPADRDVWIATSARGWSSDPVLAGVVAAFAEVALVNSLMTHFLVEHDAAPIATGSLGSHAGVALLAGASTIPAGRGLGAQGLLLAARLIEARRSGCDLAMMVSEPGSTSQRNAERRGFRVAYTRSKWRRARA